MKQAVRKPAAQTKQLGSKIHSKAIEDIKRLDEWKRAQADIKDENESKECTF